MDNEMIERVAQAICGDNNPANILEVHRIRARGAIKAMREPTEKMIEDGANVDFHDEYRIGETMAKSVYQAMIDAVIND